MAAANNWTPICKLLLEYGAKVDPQNKYKCSPLHWAAMNGNKEVVELLVSCKADVMLKNDLDKLPSHLSYDMGFVELSV